MNKEIELRSLIVGNLSLDRHDVGPLSLCQRKDINLVQGSLILEEFGIELNKPVI